MSNESIVEILKSRIVPTVGCTDTVAIAYGAALIKHAVRGIVKKATVTVDKNIYKNAFRVVIPGTKLQGLDYACALGLAGGKHHLLLQVLRDIGDEDIEQATSLVKDGKISVCISNQPGLYIEVYISTGGGEGRCRIEKSYTNVTRLEVNNKVIWQNEDGEGENAGELFFADLGMDRLLEFVKECPLEDLAFIDEGCSMNFKIAEKGLETLGTAKLCQANARSVDAGAIDSSVVAHVKMLTASAAYMRMDGSSLPVMATAGSGNQGIAASVPVTAIAKLWGNSKDSAIRAATLSHLVTICIKERIGIVSQVCGGIAAGAGASAGIAFLLGGDKKTIIDSITNTIGGLAGMICDGAKRGCALKLSISAGAAVEAALLAFSGIVIPPHDGIVGSSLDETIENLASVSLAGMSHVDDVLMGIMHKSSGAIRSREGSKTG